MKRSGFSEEQIAYVLRLAESGTPVVDDCRQIDVIPAHSLRIAASSGTSACGALPSAFSSVDSTATAMAL